MALARGDWLGFLDDDDTFVPGFFAEFLRLAGPANAQCFYFNYNRVSETRTPTTVNVLSRVGVDLSARLVDSLDVKNFIPNNAIFVNRRLVSGCLFDATLRSHEDWDWILSLRDSMSLRFLNAYGSNVHVDESEQSRNRPSNASSSVGLDHLTIYRRWPAKTQETRRLRSERLLKLGVDTNPNLL